MYLIEHVFCHHLAMMTDPQLGIETHRDVMRITSILVKCPS